MTEKKQPEAGEFWEYNGVRIFIAGRTTKGLLSCEYRDGTMAVFRRGDFWTYLPECDSFEWRPKPQETREKTYVRVWLNQQSGHVSITDAESNIELVGCDELKHDGTGFHLSAQ